MYLLSHRKSRITGRLLASTLGLPHRFKTPRPGDSLAIRWGNPQYPDRPTLIQQADAIARAGNKLVALQCFKRDGVECPEFYTSIRDVPREPDAIWFGRETHGMCGRDIQVIRADGYGIISKQAPFYTRFIPNTREYRIHVFGEEILAVMGKYLDYPADAGEGYIKNVSHGYRFRTPSRALKPDRADAAIAAVKALGLNFGAVDLVISQDGSRPYVLEVNTAPALAPLTMDKYVAAFKQKLGI